MMKVEFLTARGMLFQQLKSKVTSVHWSPLNIADRNKAVLSGDATPKSMELYVL
jgi:hypothetical protein